MVGRSSQNHSSYSETADFPKVTLENCVFYRNSAQFGGAVRFASKIGAVLEGNIFYENLATMYGGAISSSAFRLELTNNTIYKNRAQVYGGAMHKAKYNDDITTFTSIYLAFNIFSENIKGTTDKTSLGSDIGLATSTTESNNIKINSGTIWPNRVQFDFNDMTSSFFTGNIFIWGGGVFTEPVEFFDIQNYDFRLKYSYNLFSYSSFYGQEDDKVDINGLPRRIGRDVDLGAHEWQYAASSDGILYVRPGAKGYGTSWDDAAGDLSFVNQYIKMSIEASRDIYGNSRNPHNHNVTKIYLAEGTYKPKFGMVPRWVEEWGEYSNSGIIYDPTSKYTFFDLFSGISIYGGFSATGNPTFEDRNPILYKTILSGDINEDDTISGSGSTLALNNRTDNLNNILVGIGTDGNVTLDGLTFKGGHANANDYNMYILTNQTFSTTVYRGNGGAIYLHPGVDALNFNVQNCVFEENFASGLEENMESYGGGAVFISGTNTLSRYNFVNNKFHLNYTTGKGAALYISNSLVDSNHFNIVNSTFYGNRALKNGVIYNDSFDNRALSVKNTILFNNSVLNNKVISNRSLDFPSTNQILLNSIVQDYSGTTNGNINASGLTATDIFKSIDRASANYLKLADNGPAVNTGNNSAYLAAYPSKDIEGNTRVIATTIDLGAFENQCNVSAPTASAQSFCGASTVANLVASGTNLKWYAAATGGSALSNTVALSSGTYYVSQTNGTCESSRTSVVVTVNNVSAPTASAQSFCGTSTVANLVASGTNLKWYAAATGGSALSNTAALSSGTYYVSQTNGTCESSRTSVVVTVNIISTLTANSSQSFIEGATLASLVTNQINVTWYASQSDATTRTNPLSNSSVLINGNTYYGVKQVNSCSSNIVAVTVEVTLSLDNFETKKLIYYPNPVDEELNISYPDTITEIQVFNILGMHILTQKENKNEVKINTTYLSSGSYIVHIKTLDGLKTLKIIKK